MSFDPAAVNTAFGSLFYFKLAWFSNSTGVWKNAVLGNSGTTKPTFFNRAYNPATDFHLGYYGIDAAHHVVWAVVNHNSKFAALQFPAEPSDFNLDGQPDYVLFNPTTQQTSIVTLNGLAAGSTAVGPVVTAGYQLAAVADVNQDGHSDFVLYNSTTRHTAVWYLNGAKRTTNGPALTLPAGWSLVAAGDFNGDGKPDFVLYNASNQQTAIWYLNAGAFVSSANGPTLPAGWSLVAVADFNGDGSADYVLFNTGTPSKPSTRQTAIWYMNGATFVSAANGPTTPGGWVLQGAADFNADAQPDFVLANPTTHQSLIWYLNGATYTGGAAGPTLTAGYNLIAP